MAAHVWGGSAYGSNCRRDYVIALVRVIFCKTYCWFCCFTQADVTVLCFALNDFRIIEASELFQSYFCQAFLDKFVAVTCRILCLDVILFAFCPHVHAMLCIERTMPQSQHVCLSVRPSHAGILLKWLGYHQIYFTIENSHTILAFPYNTVSQYSDRDPWRGCQMERG